MAIQDVGHSNTVLRRLIPRSKVIQTLMVSKLNKFPAFYVNPRFITAFTRSHHLSLHSSRSTQSMSSQPIPWGPVLILSFHLCQSHPSSLFPSGFVTKPCRHLATHPTHLILFDRPNNIWRRISDQKLAQTCKICFVSDLWKTSTAFM